jgi:hypothetical protein
MSSLFLSCSWTGIAGATGLVLLTTLDDCVWLVPFVAAAPTRRIATVHAILFVSTLGGLAILLSIGTLVVVNMMIMTSVDSSSSSSSSLTIQQEDDPLLAIAAATLCWILAGYLIFKRWQKQRRRKRQQRNNMPTINTTTAIVAVDNHDYGAIPSTSDTPPNTTPTTAATAFETPPLAQPGIVMSLTVLGFLDEVAYFPSLILGHVFSAVELCLGSLLAGLLMVAIVTLCLAPCQPLIEWLDNHVKMYAVVTLFAIVLTIQVLVQEL